MFWIAILRWSPCKRDSGDGGGCGFDSDNYERAEEDDIEGELCASCDPKKKDLNKCVSSLALGLPGVKKGLLCVGSTRHLGRHPYAISGLNEGCN